MSRHEDSPRNADNIMELGRPAIAQTGATAPDASPPAQDNQAGARAQPMTMPGTGLQTRDALAALADSDLIGGVLDDWRVERGRPAAGPWRREYARHHPGPESWAVCVYAAGDGSLVRIDALCGPDRADLVHPTIGPLRIAEFPDDAALPGLGEVMAMLEHVQVVRYRPGSRCTLRGFVSQGERFVKVAPGGERVHADALKLWEAFKGGVFSVSVAEPCGWHAPTSSCWQGVVPGRPVACDLFAAGGDRMARRLGEALGELATSKLVPSLTSPAAEHLLRTTRTIARAALVLPTLEPRLSQVSAELGRRHAALPARALAPVHGAPHMHQWLVQGARLGLIDFDRFALGEPEFDLATFVAELDTERALQKPVAAIEAALIEGFESKGTSIDPVRARLYRIYKRMATVTRRAWAVRPDADVRAEHHLRTVEAMLEQT